MSYLLLYYQRPEPATWVFLSSFLLFGLYFVFHRVWSIRNLDLVLLFLLAPGLMMVYEGRKARIESAVSAANHAPLARTLIGNSRRSREEGAIDWSGAQSVIAYRTTDELHSSFPSSRRDGQERFTTFQSVDGRAAAGEAEDTQLVAPSASDTIRAKPKSSWTPDELEFRGFVFLLIACALLMTRMLIDPALVRRPLLEPNLSIGGLSFIGVSLFFFLMANVIVSNPREQNERGPRLGPGYALLNMLPDIPTTPEHQISEWSDESTEQRNGLWLQNLARVLAILANFVIVFGIVAVGYWHFENIKTGIGCATMYLLLPYTAQMTGDVEHALPAAMLTLAVLTYRQPLLAGCFLGLAAGLVYYPFFLLPLWMSFYWQRGLGRLMIGVSMMLLALAGLLLLGGFQELIDHLRQMFGLWSPMMKNLQGIWGELGINPIFRLPVLVGFILLSASFAFWPTRRNLGTLICGTAAIMLAAQFWHGFGGGLYMAWFLPFVLLTIFRPNLDDRVGSKVVSPSWRRFGHITVSNI